jgi:hypothetical protein
MNRNDSLFSDYTHKYIFLEGVDLRRTPFQVGVSYRVPLSQCMNMHQHSVSSLQVRNNHVLVVEY